MKMRPDISNYKEERKTDIRTGDRFYELSGDLYSLAFFAFYIDDEEREEKFLYECIKKQI